MGSILINSIHITSENSILSNKLREVDIKTIIALEFNFFNFEYF